MLKKLLSLTILACLLSLNAYAKTTIRRGTGGEPASLDPHKISGTWEHILAMDLFTGLVESKADGSIIPGVAKSWDVSEDKKVYTFHLREDAFWNDGTPLTADDFVFAYRRILDPMTAARYASLLYTIKNAEAINSNKLKDLTKLGVKAIDKKTLEITLEFPAPYFIAQLNHYTAYPVPKHIVEKYGNEWSKPANFVSNGAFKVVEWKNQSHIKAVKNEKFYDAKNIKVDEVIYYPTEDNSAALKRFRAGELDINTDFPSEQLQWVKENLKDEALVYPYVGLFYYAINFRDKKFQDKRVREALNLAINREIITEKISGTGEIAAYNIVPPLNGYEGASFKFKDMPYKDRLKRAKELLKEAGYSKDNPLEVNISYNTSEGLKKISIAVASMWKPLGVKAELSNAEVVVHYNNLQQGEFSIGRAGWSADYPDPYNFLFLFETNLTGMNYGDYRNPNFDKLVKQANMIVDAKERAKLLKEAEQIALDDYAAIPVYFQVKRALVSKKIKGFEPNSSDLHPTRWMSKE